MFNIILGSCGLMSIFILPHLHYFVKMISNNFFFLISSKFDNMSTFDNPIPNVNNYHICGKTLTDNQKVIIIISRVFIVGVLR